MAVLPTGFGKYIIYQSFVIAKNFANTASIVVVVPLRSIVILNYTSGACVVDFFYSGPRRKIQMRHNF